MFKRGIFFHGKDGDGVETRRSYFLRRFLDGYKFTWREGMKGKRER